MRAKKLDLNADLGEIQGDYLELLSIVTSANIACGAHAGGGQLLEDTVSQAILHEVSIGAHPAYPDRDNFGRVSMRGQIPTQELLKLLIDQVEAVKEIAEQKGSGLTHIKAHGALYNDGMTHEDTADILCELAANFDLPLFGLPNSILQDRANKRRLTYIAEGFIDRAYTGDGKLTPRSMVGSLLTQEQSLEQVERIATFGEVTSIDGVQVEMPVQTLCIHADTPNSAQAARSVRALLEDLGVEVLSFSKWANS